MRTRLFFVLPLVGFSSALAATPAHAQPSTAPSIASWNPDISAIVDVSFAWFSPDEARQTGAHDPEHRGFNLQQLELAFSKAVDPYFRLDANAVFDGRGAELEEAYGTTLGLPANLQVRAGQFLTRFGRINSTHPHSWDFVDQPFMLGKLFGGEGNRAPGAELSWLAPLPWYVELVGSATDASGEETARSFFGADAEAAIDSPLDFQLSAMLKQFFPLSDNWSLLWGLSSAFGPNGTGENARTQIFGTDLYVKFRPVTEASYTIVAFQAEAFLRRRAVSGDRLRDFGGYASMLWHFSRRWGTAVRYEYGSPTWGASDAVVVDPLDPLWIDDRHRASLNVTFWPTEFSRLRLQGAHDRGGAGENPVWAMFLNFEFLAGAHGAHVF